MAAHLAGVLNIPTDYYGTPDDVATAVVSIPTFPHSIRALEPSAGMGVIAEKMRACGWDVDVCEINENLRNHLIKNKFNVIGEDFLSMPPNPVYNVVIMNPPWSNGAWKQHIDHARKFLLNYGTDKFDARTAIVYAILPGNARDSFNGVDLIDVGYVEVVDFTERGATFTGVAKKSKLNYCVLGIY